MRSNHYERKENLSVTLQTFITGLFPKQTPSSQTYGSILEDYLEAHSNASIEDILTELGTPEDAAKLYLEDNFHDYISYTKKQHILVIIMIVVVFLFMIYGTYNYVQNHWIATIVYETAVEGTYPPDAE